MRAGSRSGTVLGIATIIFGVLAMLMPMVSRLTVAVLLAVPLIAGGRTSNTYYDWMADRMYLAVPAQRYVAKFLGTFKEYPPRMKPGSFTIDKVMEKLQTPATH